MMKSIKRALISVSDKNKLNFLIKNLQKYNIEIISTGGTFKKSRNLVSNALKYLNTRTLLKF